MNIVIFTGRVAVTPELEIHGETKVTRFRLIRNEYAGQDGNGERRERQVNVPFTAFGRLAEMLAGNVLVGDQLIVHASIRNNHFTDSNGVERYDYNFEVREVEFGAPGSEKRKRLADHSAKSNVTAEPSSPPKKSRRQKSA